ncbi:hypothetical protein SAY87_022577 [Trapa incisa]|uniref:DNA repair protein recA homolog 2, mitochondrial n=1 Tax=Trapa incisa TaxID=236973 RepID=A0AAN7K404_9MYRT|nr:hypothetical protein SAY87_022577 [Trapa incisa]
MAFLVRSAAEALRRRAACGLSLSSPLFPLLQGKGCQPTNLTGHKHSFSSTMFEGMDFGCEEMVDNPRISDKENALREVLASLASDFGRESMLSLQRFFRSRRQPVISTGSLMLDLALGIGGLPKGRIVEIYGQEASGKTTLALHLINEAQKLGGFCAYFDVENALDASLAESMGINTEKLLFVRPSSAENLLSAVDTLAKSGSVDVIVVDSVAALVPQCEIDVPVGTFDRDLQSRIMTQALRKINYSLSQSKTLIIFVNQVRLGRKTGQSCGNVGEVTCGGNALNFYAAVRLRLSRRELLKYENKVIGLGICVQVMKNKLAPAMKKAELRILFSKGFFLEAEVFDLALEHGIIFREGDKFHIEGKVFSDKEKSRQFLAENADVLGKITALLRQQLFET